MTWRRRSILIARRKGEERVLFDLSKTSCGVNHFLHTLLFDCDSALLLFIAARRPTLRSGERRRRNAGIYKHRKKEREEGRINKKEEIIH